MDGSRFVDKLAHLYLLLAQDTPRAPNLPHANNTTHGSDRVRYILDHGIHIFLGHMKLRGLEHHARQEIFRL